MFYCICLPHVIFHRSNSTAPTPHCTSQQLNHYHSSDHATQSKLTLLRRQNPPAIPSFPQPSRRAQQIQGFQRCGAGVSPSIRRHIIRPAKVSMRHLWNCPYRITCSRPKFTITKSYGTGTTDHQHTLKTNFPVLCLNKKFIYIRL